MRGHADALLGDHGRPRRWSCSATSTTSRSAATTQILLGPPGSEIGTGGFDRPDQGDAERLWNLAPLLPERAATSAASSTAAAS